jgi:hypothetical protein
MVKANITRDTSGRIVVSFPYDPLRSIGKIKSPLDTLTLKKGGDGRQ